MAHNFRAIFLVSHIVNMVDVIVKIPRGRARESFLDSQRNAELMGRALNESPEIEKGSIRRKNLSRKGNRSIFCRCNG